MLKSDPESLGTQEWVACNEADGDRTAAGVRLYSSTCAAYLDTTAAGRCVKISGDGVDIDPSPARRRQQAAAHTNDIDAAP